MADYYPLIARAITGLEQNSGENRRALYDRARTALVSQLRSTTPALDESEITRERLALEDAIRRIESENARRRTEPPQDEQPPSPPPVAAKPATPSLTDRGLRGFREIVGEADGLGGAAAGATRSARETQAVHDRPPGDRSREPKSDVPPVAFEPPPMPAPEDQPPFGEPESEPPPDTMQGDASAAPSNTQSEFEAERATESDAGWKEPPVTPRYSEGGDEQYRPRRSYGGLVKALVLLLVIAGLAAGGWFYRSQIMSMVASLRSSPAPTAQQQQPAQPRNQKITDRVGGDQRGASTAPTADVAQKVVLYDEDPKDSQGKRYVGSAIWKSETVSPGPGLAPELALRADVEIPERRIRMSWSIRRNTDKALPASHTIEIMFTLPADFAEGGIQNVPGVLMKQNEQARGVPLAGLAVKVTNNFFLIGLSSVPVDLERNIQLLKDRGWFDVPIVYNTGKRAILAVEKGPPGDRLFEEAFRTWGQ